MKNHNSQFPIFKLTRIHQTLHLIKRPILQLSMLVCFANLSSSYEPKMFISCVGLGENICTKRMLLSCYTYTKYIYRGNVCCLFRRPMREMIQSEKLYLYPLSLLLTPSIFVSNDHKQVVVRVQKKEITEHESQSIYITIVG